MLEEQLQPLPETHDEIWNTWKDDPKGFYDRVLNILEDESVLATVRNALIQLFLYSNPKYNVEDEMEEDEEDNDKDEEDDEDDDEDDEDEDELEAAKEVIKSHRAQILCYLFEKY